MFLVRLENRMYSKLFYNFDEAITYFVELSYEYNEIPQLICLN